MVHFDDKVAMYSAILTLLQRERYQKLAVARDSMPLLMALMSDTYNIDFKDLSGEGDTDLRELIINRRETIGLMRTNVSERIMDLSELPEFTSKYLPSSTIVQELCMWLPEEKEAMQECACYVLRNVVSTTEKAMHFIQDEQGRHRLEYVTRLLGAPQSSQAAQQGLRLLRHLAQSESNKLALTTDSSMMVAVILLCSNSSHDSVQQDALTTIRVLLSGSFFNVRQLFQIAEPTPCLTHLLSLYTHHQDLNIRMELGLLMIEIFKVAFQETDEQSKADMIMDTISLAKQADLNAALPIAALITDSHNPSLVTKGWLGLALLAFSPEGSDEVYDYMHIDQNFQRLREIIGRQKARSQDQDNVRVLHARLRMRYVSFKASRCEINLLNVPS